MQRLLPGQDVPDRRWTLFSSDALDRLVREALAYRLTTAAAQASLRPAQENLHASEGTAWPRVDANASASRQRFSPAAFGQPNAPSTVFTLYNVSVAISYIFDIAGGRSRDLEALRAGVDFQSFQTEATYLALTSNVVTTAIGEASLRAQLRLPPSRSSAPRSLLGRSSRRSLISVPGDPVIRLDVPLENMPLAMKWVS